MGTTNLAPFPWQILLDWYTENGRHDLPWREYDIQGKINDSKLKIKDEKGEMRSYDCTRHPDEGRIQEITGILDSSLHSEGRNQRHNQSSGILNLESLIYRVWLSEILLQQTQASRVVGFFDRMIAQFPTIESLANTDYETFFPYYQGLGYYSRAKNILRTAKIIHEQYGGVFPKETRELIQLPGVGPYTSEAIRAFGYGIPTLSWDTNLEKTFARYYHGTRNERLSKEEKSQVEEDFHKFINDESSEMGVRGNPSPLLGEIERDIPPRPSYKEGNEQTLVRSINNALMDFAAMVDLGNPASINWSEYPIQSGRFYETRGSLEPQEAKKSVTFPTPDATIIVTLHENHRVYYSDKIGDINYKILSEKLLQELGKNISYLISHTSYLPFFLPPALTRNTREYVKSYFREKYNLELSVRPPHRKWFSEDGRPYIAVNAQVQVGEVTFQKWNKKGEKI